MPDKQYAIAFLLYVFVLIVALILALLNIITLIQQMGIILVAFGLLQLVKKRLLKNNNDEHKRNQEGS